MTISLNDSAAQAVRGLAAALRAAGLPGDLSGLATAEDQTALGEASDLCSTLATSLADVSFAAAEAAQHAFFVFGDQARRRLGKCTWCSTSLHPKGMHTTAATLSDTALDSGEPLCGCYCQRRK